MRSFDRLGILLTALVLLLDQATKWVVVQHMVLHQSIPIIPGFLNLTYVRNTGAAFGMFASPSPGLRSALLLLFSLVAIGLIAWIWIRDRRASGLYVSSLGLILGGALGNLLDRARLGEVVDFVDAYWGRYHWPAFNVADSAITVGVALFALHLVFQPRAASSNK
jgi:signal peptidase II